MEELFFAVINLNDQQNNKITTQDGSILLDSDNQKLVANSYIAAHAKICNPPAVATFITGRIDNIDELSAKYNLAYEDINQFFHQLYLALGSNISSLIKGNFIYFILDDNNKELRVGIDSFNANQLFYVIERDTINISSNCARLTALAAINKQQLNIDSVALWLSGQPDPMCSMFEQIATVPNGHEVCISYNQSSTITSTDITKLWDIDPAKQLSFNSDEQYAEQFYELLNKSVESRLNQHQVVASQLSGGLDSTSISAIANQLSQRYSKQHYCVSHTYKNTASCNEIDNIQAMLKRLTTNSNIFVELDKYQSLTFAQLYPCSFNNPGIVLSPKYIEEIKALKALDCSLLLTGNGGDEVCWGHSATYRSRLFKGDLKVVREVLKACDTLSYSKAAALKNVFIKPSLSDLLQLIRGPKQTHAKLPLPSWLSESAKKRTQDARKANPFNYLCQPDKYYRYQSIKTTSTYNSMRSYQSIANQHGIDVQHPFFDQDLIEFSFAIPQKMLIRGAYPKWLLRQSMSDWLPEQVCWNLHKTTFDQHFANIIRSNAAEIYRLLSHPGLQDLGLICNKTILREFDKVLHSEKPALNVDMLYAILTQQWFQAHIA
ncbi:asparagine synthase C-terminal domain-containing protein [Catenovulum agarivorans]|uniref:asparagine synthase-related protein n=1 Tax=Catenovulum agarivorans TaxID=1172192 RepID=UPI0003188B4D|nr:asparagine synthase C-terminal domain-containing protein [Catenovulum agarivorans]